MLEKIPAYNNSASTNSISVNNAPISLPTNVASTLDLAPVVIYPSRYLWIAECAVYGAMFLFATIALLPFFLIAFYWPFFWLLFAIFIAVVIHRRWLQKNAQPITLSVKQGRWYLVNQTIKDPAIAMVVEPHCVEVQPCADILFWSLVIVVSLREISSANKYCVVVLPDSVSAEDWRHLRVWLRTCLHR